MRRAIFVLALCLMAGETTAESTAETMDEKFQAVLDGAVLDGIPAVSASVIWADHRWMGSAGTSSSTDGAALSADSRFRLASVTKLFTATVILQLVDEERLALDDTLAGLLPDSAAAKIPGADRITVALLLDHRSGVRSFTDIDAFWKEAYGNRGLDRLWLPEEQIDYALMAEPYFEPGAAGKRHYSNTNYVLLGMLIEQLTTGTLAENYRERIFEPLQMVNTILEGFEPGMDSVQHSFHKAGFGERLVAKRRGWIKAPGKGVYDLGASYRQYNSWAWAAGAVSSNTADLNRFFDALRSQILLSASSGKLLFEMNSADVDSGVVFGGSGGWDGITSSAYDVNGEVKVIVLANGTGFGVSANDLMSALFQVYKQN